MVVKSGIYRLINLVNQKIYIGSAIDLKRRHREHMSRLLKKSHENRHLLRVFLRYGQENFFWEVIEYIEDVSKLIEREQYYIDSYKSYEPSKGYNISKVAGSSLGLKRSKEQIINYLLGRKCRYFNVYKIDERKFLGTFLSKKDCAKFLGLVNGANINGCLKNEKKTLADCVFIYQDELDKLEEKFEYAKVESRKLFGIYKEGQLLGSFKNGMECARQFNVCHKKISLCLKNKRPQHKGYTFKYIEDNNGKS